MFASAGLEQFGIIRPKLSILTLNLTSKNMKTKTIVVALVVALAIIGLFAWGYAGGGRNTQAPSASVQGVRPSDVKSVLAVPETFYDFGNISMKDGVVSKEFTVSNPTDKNIALSKVFTSCMCTTALIVRPDGSVNGPFGMPGHNAVPPANEDIKAGESRVIRVVFDPNAHGPAGVGTIERFVTLAEDSGGSVLLGFKATVTP